MNSTADQQIWHAAPSAEPLDYVTQSRRPSVPEQPLLRRPRANSTPQVPSDNSGYRVRDFSPEARGASFSSTASAPWTPPAAGSENLDYQTALGAQNAAPAAPTGPNPAPPVVVTHDEPADVAPAFPSAQQAEAEEHTLTRRQMRELRNAGQPAASEPTESLPTDVSPEVRVAEVPAPEAPVAEAPAAEASVPAAPAAEAPAAEAPAPVAPIPSVAPRPDQSAELAAAMAEFDALYASLNVPAPPPPLIEPPLEARGASSGAAVPAPAPVVMPEPAPVAMPERTPVAMPEPTPVPMPEPMPAAMPEPTPVAMPEPAPAVSPQPVFPPEARPAIPSEPMPEPEQPAPAPVAEVRPVAPEPLREVITAPEVYAAPAGHWSNQTTINDDVAGVVGTHSRNLAASDSITTSALVLPAFPQTGPFTAPLSSTGEILVTGSIDLPRSLGMNGLNPSRYDRSDIDAVIDAGDREDSAPDSAPVRAIRAVSTHTSSQGIINAKRPKGSNLPMILSISAGVMAVGVIVLFVAGLVFKIF